MAAPEIRGHAEIEASMVSAIAALAPELTDYTESATIRALCSATAALVIEMEHLAYAITRSGIVNGTFQNFEIIRKPATPATGTIVLTRSSADNQFTVPKGTQFGVPGSSQRTYESIADVSLAIGIFSVNVAIRCLNAGIVGRTGAQTIAQVITTLGGTAVFSCINERAILNGAEEESDTEKRSRLREHLASLSRGTKESIEYAAKQVSIVDVDGITLESVQAALVREPFLDDNPPGLLGLVQVYIDNGSGAASPELVERVRKTLRGYEENGEKFKGWIAASIDLDVFAVVGIPLDVTAVLTVGNGYDILDVRSKVKDAFGSYLNGLGVFATARIADFVAAAKGVAGVVDVSMIAPAANVTPAEISRIVPGVISIL